jgi:hypothetical protein
MRRIAATLPEGDPARAQLLAAANPHVRAGLAHVNSGDYAGAHWLAFRRLHADAGRSVTESIPLQQYLPVDKLRGARPQYPQLRPALPVIGRWSWPFAIDFQVSIGVDSGVESESGISTLLFNLG